MVKFKFQNRLTYTIIAVFVLVVVAIGINAYGTSDPSVLGHTFGELTPPSGCAANQVVRWTGSTWDCVAPNAGDITGVNTPAGSGLSGGASSGEVTLSLANPIKTCPAGQVMSSFNLGVSIAPSCISAGGTLNVNTYSALDGVSTSMGAHKFCFLTQVKGPDNTDGCLITEASGIWTLKAGSSTGRCQARCVD